MDFTKSSFILYILAVAVLALLTVVTFGSKSGVPLDHPATEPDEAHLTISGKVSDETGPVAGAIVRLQATDNSTTTSIDGTFTLDRVTKRTSVTITAWAEGYYVGWTEASPGADTVLIILKRHYITDNPDYDWFSAEGDEGSRSCGHCMSCAYDEWQGDAHSRSATNPRFLTMYNGTDVIGNRSPRTRYSSTPGYSRRPLRPNTNQPYYGPGYKLDNPSTAGNCATCHVPAAAARPGRYYAADVNDASGIDSEGIFCEFCHKIGEVELDPETQLPRENMPGVLSMKLFRPHGDEQLFFGPYDDVTRRVSYLPLQRESAFCAPCHYGVFWGTVIYNSYGEWLESPYSDPSSGKSCQDCHMPMTTETRFVLQEKGGLERPPGGIRSHTMPGAADQELLQNAVKLDVKLEMTAHSESKQAVVTVTVTNDRTGHHVPTGSPLRHLILLVQATGPDGKPISQLDGPTVPDWCGVGDPAQGYYAGLPGTAYAKVLQDWWTEVAPTGAYWNQTRLLSDNRIAAFAADTSHLTFDAADHGEVTVNVKLLFRRAYISLMKQKGWKVPDILMAQQALTFREPLSFHALREEVSR
jgi:hypothetical protein